MFGLHEAVDEEGCGKPEEAAGNPYREGFLKTDRDVGHRGIPLSAVIERV